MDDWLVIYRTYDAEELDVEITFLKQEMSNPYSAQGLGSQSAQRDLRQLTNRLSAAIRVKNERGGNPTIRDSLVDFSLGLNIR
jgi:hypothetical protein